MKLQVEKKEFKDEKTGDIVEYLSYYVVVKLGENQELKLNLKPANATAKELLSIYVK